MKPLIYIISLLAIMLLLTGFINERWQDYSGQIGKTTVSNKVAGSDWQWVLATHRSEAAKLTAFAETYNKIAYQPDLSQDDLCQELEQAATVAIEQTNKSFYGLYEVECITDVTDSAPGIKMVIYPKVRWDYRFIITFKPTP